MNTLNTSKHGTYLTFFGLVLLLSTPFWILAAVKPIELMPGLPLSALGILAPMLAALILTYSKDKFSGVIHLLSRIFDFNRIKDWKLYIIIIFTTPIVAFLAYEVLHITNKSIPNPAPLTLSVIPLFLTFFVGGFIEEVGWSGYITMPLVRNWGIVKAGIILGSIWAVWHYIPLLQVHRSIEWIAWWSLATLSLRMIMVWLYVRSNESIFSTSLLHAISNLCWQLFPINGSYYDPKVFGLITFTFAVIILLFDKYRH